MLGKNNKKAKERWNGRKVDHFSLKKLSVGVVSVAVSSSLFFFNSQEVAAEEGEESQQVEALADHLSDKAIDSEDSDQAGNLKTEDPGQVGDFFTEDGVEGQAGEGDFEPDAKAEWGQTGKANRDKSEDTKANTGEQVSPEGQAKANTSESPAGQKESQAKPDQESLQGSTRQAIPETDQKEESGADWEAKVSKESLDHDNTGQLKEAQYKDTIENVEESDYERTDQHLGGIKSINHNQNQIEIEYETGQTGRVDIYTDKIIRFQVEQEGNEFVDTPEPSQPDKPAEIITKDLDDFDVIVPTVTETENYYEIATDSLVLELDKKRGTAKLYKKGQKDPLFEEAEPLQLSEEGTKQTLKANENTYYFGGGTQNGRFSHKGERINIVNENNWVDGGVASPNPFYWTTDGYGVIRHTFQPGVYDFEKTDSERVTTTHLENRFDAFYIVGDTPQEILQQYYELTGYPIVLPAYSLYEGHLNAYNRDYWMEVEEGTPGAVYFEELDGWFFELQPEQASQYPSWVLIRETLTGEPGDLNYPFTASAVLDRYQRNDMPLGWILVNDGYGAGYGQEDSLEGNILNLRKFAEEARDKGVVTGLWTESELTPDESLPPLLQRDLANEVGKALVRVLKTDVAWVGPGYSFGLHGTQQAGDIMENASGGSRRFIISLDGWAGTQRNAAVWTGDQNGGEWEYIRFHIPTYIGTGLSGNPNVTSDMDGIFGGRNPIVNTRDYQWKTFTGMQLNMDGWGDNPKTPFTFDTTTTDLNRSYLKLKSQLMPYTYSLMHHALEGEPIVRAMFIDFPDEEVNYTPAVNYQFMFGENFLVAPIYENVKMDENGNDVRNNIYLPKGEKWIDYYTGEVYDGGYFLHNFDAPIWKLPVFVRAGAIIPMAKPSNNIKEYDPSYRAFDIYPYGQTSFTLVEDDGYSIDYRQGKVAKTVITSTQEDDHVSIEVNPTQGEFEGQVKEKINQFNINVTSQPGSVDLFIDGEKVELETVSSQEEFEKGTNVIYYDAEPDLNQYSTEGGAFYGKQLIKNPVLRIKTDFVSINSSIKLEVEGFVYDKPVNQATGDVRGEAPDLIVEEEGITSDTITLTWSDVPGAQRYDLLVDDILHVNIKEPIFTQTNLRPETTYTFRVRAVFDDHVTEWSSPKTVKTAEDDFSWAITVQNIQADFDSQPGQDIEALVDGDPSSHFHSHWDKDSVPGRIQMDMGKVYTINRLAYQPRTDGGTNGIITKMDIAYSIDGSNWHRLDENVEFQISPDLKFIDLDEAIQARYLVLTILETADNEFISGNEFYIFQEPNSKPLVAGDVTGDGKVDSSDIMSFKNYAGLRRGDSDFDGYIEVADLNQNGFIDAYDIYLATRQLSSQVSPGSEEPQEVNGHLTLVSDKKQVNAGDTFTLSLVGQNLKGVHAINGVIPLSTNQLSADENIKISNEVQTMENFSRIRTHANGETVAYIILANYKNSPSIEGNSAIASITLKAEEDLDLEELLENLNDQLFFLVGKDMKVIQGLVEETSESDEDYPTIEGELSVDSVYDFLAPVFEWNIDDEEDTDYPTIEGETSVDSAYDFLAPFFEWNIDDEEDTDYPSIEGETSVDSVYDFLAPVFEWNIDDEEGTDYPTIEGELSVDSVYDFLAPVFEWNIDDDEDTDYPTIEGELSVDSVYDFLAPVFEWNIDDEEDTDYPSIEGETSVDSVYDFLAPDFEWNIDDEEDTDYPSIEGETSVDSVYDFLAPDFEWNIDYEEERDYPSIEGETSVDSVYDFLAPDFEWNIDYEEEAPTSPSPDPDLDQDEDGQVPDGGSGQAPDLDDLEPKPGDSDDSEDPQAGSDDQDGQDGQDPSDPADSQKTPKASVKAVKSDKSSPVAPSKDIGSKEASQVKDNKALDYLLKQAKGEKATSQKATSQNPQTDSASQAKDSKDQDTLPDTATSAWALGALGLSALLSGLGIQKFKKEDKED